MYKSTSNFLNGIRHGIGTSLKRKKKNQDLTKVVKKMHAEAYSIAVRFNKNMNISQKSTNDVIANNSLLDRGTAVSNIIELSSNTENAKPDVSSLTKKKKRGWPVSSKSRNLTAKLLNTIPGRSCPKCGKCFRGFHTDAKGNMTTKCCLYKTFYARHPVRQ